MTSNISGSHMEFWVGQVTDIRDPNGGSGKVRVNIFGHTNSGNTPTEEENIPWAHCVMNNSASLNGIGHSVKYLAGSVVMGFWLDPHTKQIPIVLGSLPRAALPSDSTGS